jgi:hypothetical protein
MDNNRHGLGIQLEVGFDAMENSYDEIWKANDDLYSTQDEFNRNQKWMFSMLEDVLTYMKYNATIHGFASNQGRRIYQILILQKHRIMQVLLQS